MAAALITTILKSGFQDWIDDNYDLPEFVRRVNRNLCRLVPDGSFAALFAAIYDDRTRELTYCNCGHNPEPWVMPARADEPIRALSDARMMLLGVEQTVDLHVSRRRLDPGDKVVMATDGLVDAQRGDGERFSQQRLEELLRACRDRPVKELVEAAVSEVAKFAGRAEQTDDRTVLAFQIK